MTIRREMSVLAVGLLAATSAMALAAFTAEAPAKAAGQRVDNFMLPDQTGLGHELYYHTKAQAVVIVSADVSDKNFAKSAAAVAKVRDAYKGKGVEVWMLDSSLKTSRDDIISKAAGVDVPVLDDELQLVGRAMGVRTTGEAFLIDPKAGWSVVYHGPVDASTAAKKVKGGALDDALAAMLAGSAVPASEVKVKGAKIDFPERNNPTAFSKISYTNDVAPILSAKCVVCHTKGGMGPFAMDRFETIKAFSPMIREVLRTKRMPPYHADAHWGVWSDDMRLSPEQIKTVVNWVEGGAQRGEGDDPLARVHYTPPKWPMGEPDAVVDIPAFDVPAAGVIDYQERSVATNFGDGQGRWLKATAWSGASATVHHALAGWIPQVREDGKGFSWNTSLGGYGPGGEANLTPDDTGIWVPPGGSYAYQMHYTTNGKATTDKTQVGYYFYKDPPKYILRQTSVTDFSIEIPAGASRWHETAYLEFPHDAQIFGTQPHCHSRCYATKLRIRYPDGSEKVLLNQPRYDFAWQREYHFKPMLEVPAGSLLIADYVFDNSVENPSNPDPNKTVTFGEQTTEEMLFTFARFRWKDETVENRHDEWMQELQRNITFGAFDDNIDGKLTPAEFRNDPRFAPLKGYLPMVDKDKDGALSKAEFNSALDMMMKMRGAGARAATAPPKEDKGADAMVKGGTGGG